MYDDEDQIERIRRECTARRGDRARLREKAELHLVRHNILVVLAQGGGRKELQARQIHCLLSRKGRPSLAAIKYHLGVLCVARLIGADDDPEDPLYKLIPGPQPR